MEILFNLLCTMSEFSTSDDNYRRDEATKHRPQQDNVFAASL